MSEKKMLAKCVSPYLIIALITFAITFHKNILPNRSTIFSYI